MPYWPNSTAGRKGEWPRQGCTPHMQCPQQRKVAARLADRPASRQAGRQAARHGCPEVVAPQRLAGSNVCSKQDRAATCRVRLVQRSCSHARRGALVGSAAHLCPPAASRGPSAGAAACSFRHLSQEKDSGRQVGAWASEDASSCRIAAASRACSIPACRQPQHSAPSLMHTVGPNDGHTLATLDDQIWPGGGAHRNTQSGTKAGGNAGPFVQQPRKSCKAAAACLFPLPPPASWNSLSPL